MSSKIMKRIAKRFESDLPEINFIDDYVSNFDEDQEDDILLESFEWGGTWSGNSFKLLTNTILTKTSGSARIRYVWEDGEISIVNVKDGIVEVEDI